VIAPIAVEQLRIAGFGRLSNEVLPDDLYPRDQLVVSRDIAERYSCLDDIDPQMSLEEAVAVIFPEDCSRQYQYYSLELEDGKSGVPAVGTDFSRVANRLNARLPAALQEVTGYFYVSQDRADLDRAVRQTSRPTVVALTVFGVVAAGATLTVVALVLARLLTRDEQARRSLLVIGATRSQRMWCAAIPPLVAVGVGLVGAVLAAVAFSPLGPVGSARDVLPDPGFAAPANVIGPAALLLGVGLLTIVIALSWAAARQSARIVQRPARASRLVGFLARGGRPALTEGVRSALSRGDRGGSAVMLTGCVVAIAAVVASVVFGANLTGLTNDERRYGWPWDAAVITGAGYGDTDPEGVAAALDRHADVVDYGFFALDSSSRIAGTTVATTFGFASASTVQLPVVNGRNAARPGEAVLGSITADQLDVDIGDRLPIETDLLDADEIEIVGTAVLPSIGPFIADRTGLGLGAFVLLDGEPAENRGGAALTGIRLRPGTDAGAFIAELRPSLTTWDLLGATPVTHTEPVRPPEIINIDSMRAAPLALAVVLGLALMVGLALSTAVSVHDRRRELAILRALGFSSRALHATVGWQALTSIAVGVIIGTPLGLLAGRFAWHTFAEQLGLVPRADIPIGWIGVVVVAAVALTLLAAVAPARAAARIAPSEVLRST